MATARINGRIFVFPGMTRSKARSLEEDSAAYRAAARSATARVRDANGDAEIACLALSEDSFSSAMFHARMDVLATAAVTSILALVSGILGVGLTVGGAFALWHAEWGNGVTAIILGPMAVTLGAMLWIMGFRFGTFTVWSKVQNLAEAAAKTLTVGEGRLYLTAALPTVERAATIREVRYDAIGSVRVDDGMLRVYDRAGLQMFAFGPSDGIEGERKGAGGFDRAVAAIRARIPDAVPVERAIDPATRT